LRARGHRGGGADQARRHELRSLPASAVRLRRRQRYHPLSRRRNPSAVWYTYSEPGDPLSHASLRKLQIKTTMYAGRPAHDPSSGRSRRSGSNGGKNLRQPQDNQADVRRRQVPHQGAEGSEGRSRALDSRFQHPPRGERVRCFGDDAELSGDFALRWPGQRSLPDRVLAQPGGSPRSNQKGGLV